MTISLQIQNSNSQYMQICTFTQPAPTLLRNSTNAVLQGWNTSIGATSNATLTVYTYFTPISTTALWIFDRNFTASALSTSIILATQTQGNSTLDYITGGTAVGRSLSFLVQITNPPTQQPVSFTFYVIYSTNLFI
jgi:hypothetical protein